MKEPKIYWVARWKMSGSFAKGYGKSGKSPPKLYLGKAAAMAAQRGYRETNEELLDRMDFIPVRLTVVGYEDALL